MTKFAGYAFLIITLILFGMLAPTLGHMAVDEGVPAYAVVLSVLSGLSFIAARAGYETR